MIESRTRMIDPSGSLFGLRFQAVAGGRLEEPALRGADLQTRDGRERLLYVAEHGDPRARLEREPGQLAELLDEATQRLRRSRPFQEVRESGDANGQVRSDVEIEDGGRTADPEALADVAGDGLVGPERGRAHARVLSPSHEVA